MYKHVLAFLGLFVMSIHVLHAGDECWGPWNESECSTLDTTGCSQYEGGWTWHESPEGPYAEGCYWEPSFYCPSCDAGCSCDDACGPTEYNEVCEWTPYGDWGDCRVDPFNTCGYRLASGSDCLFNPPIPGRVFCGSTNGVCNSCTPPTYNPCSCTIYWGIDPCGLRRKAVNDDGFCD